MAKSLQSPEYMTPKPPRDKVKIGTNSIADSNIARRVGRCMAKDKSDSDERDFPARYSTLGIGSSAAVVDLRSVIDAIVVLHDFHYGFWIRP